jgi:protein-L-isoaspartate(D-aspartate) O-methyltransferase
LLVDAFASVSRADFLPGELRASALQDRPLPIGHGQTNSQPSTVAFTLELLQPQPGDRALDVGTGSGWTTALLADAVGKDGYVYGVERIPELVEFGRDNLAKYAYEHARIVPAGDTFGLPEHAPYDKILVSAAADWLPPELVDQLAAGSRMIIAIRNTISRVDKDEDGEVDVEDYPGFAFVPLKR